MGNNTSEGGVSTTPENQDTLDKRAKLIKLAVERIGEISERGEMVHRAMVSAIPELIKEHSLGQAIDLIVMMEDAVSRMSSMSSDMNKILSYAREVTMPERMDDDEVKTFTTPGGDRVTRTSRIFASIVPNQTDAAYKWLRDNELGSLIKETVNSSSLAAAAKEQIENGKELPDDIFRTHIKSGISITRSKKKKG